VLVRERECRRVTGAVSGDARLDERLAAAHLDDRERMAVAVRVDADHVVQLICKHPIDLQPCVGGTTPVSVWGVEPRAATL
jgi:hypothetical protein